MVKPNWEAEELIEHWTLLPQELELVENKVGGNKIGFALLLTVFGHVFFSIDRQLKT